MDLQKSKILLDKINALYKNMSADKRNISTIEIDLMRSYVRQLYESFLDMPQSVLPSDSPAVEIIKSTPKVTLNRPEPKKPAPVPEPPKPAAPQKEEPPAPTPPPVVKKEATPSPAPPAPEPKPTTPPPPPKREPEPVPVNTASNDDLEELFAISSARELSEKLGEMPIKDIRKAMGLNERIFTMNELFGGDQGMFDLTLDTLNKLPDFTQAKTFLINNAASKYNWSANAKKSKAKNFIKLVKRRYN